MTLQGLNLRLKYALWQFYTDAMWGKWKIVKPKDKTLKQAYIEDCDKHILAMHSGCRAHMKEWFELKAMGRIRENIDFLDNNKTIINRARLFENISNKQDIERIERREQEHIAESKKKALKESK